MAIDVTLQVMAFPSTHTLPPHKEPGRYKRGDIVNVYPKLQQTSPISHNIRSVFIHITGVPSSAIARAKKLMKSETDETNEDEPLIRRRQFNIDPQSLPAGIKAQLLANREVTVKWAQAKPFLINMKTGTQVQDGDIA